MPYNRKNFGIVISRLRVEKGLSQEKLSGLAGIARSHLVMLENGCKTARLDTLWKIAEALEIRPSVLILRTEEEDAVCDKLESENTGRQKYGEIGRSADP